MAILLSPGDVVSIRPDDIRFKLSYDLDLGGVKGGDWDIVRRVDLTRTAKHRSIIQHFVDGVPWLETDLFRGSYANRFKAGKGVRGTVSLGELAAQYDGRVNAMFASMKADGFREMVDGRPVPLPKVHIARTGEVILGNQGNHRLAMAKVLGLAEIIVRVHTRHVEFDPS
jgi:hypothetical protein